MSPSSRPRPRFRRRSVASATAATAATTGLAAAVVLGTATPAVAGVSAAGAGANEPAWAGRVSYPVQTFATRLPDYNAAADASGFLVYTGQDVPSGYYQKTYEPTRVSYPVVSTPFGTRPVFRSTFPGQTTAITAQSQSTPAWVYSDVQYTNASVQIKGTWAGTLQFETSTDGVTWVAKTLEGRIQTGSTTGTTGSSTTSNGIWRANNSPAARELLRIRASAWTSGTASVEVGFNGGQAPVRSTAGGFNGGHSRVYTRAVFRTSANWTNNANAGTKLFFYAKNEGNNHYVCLSDSAYGGAVSPSISLQRSGESWLPRFSSITVAAGNWVDLEIELVANTPGADNGIGRIWVNGVLGLNATNVRHFNVGQTATFTDLWFDPTFGGGENSPPANQDLDLALWYRSSAP